MVDVYERERRKGGLMRYGIKDLKMEKKMIERRVEKMEGEGVSLNWGVNIGVEKKLRGIIDNYDEVIYWGG